MEETRTLHIKLKTNSSDLARFHCYTDNPNQFTPRNLNLSDINHLINLADRDYYTYLNED